MKLKTLLAISALCAPSLLVVFPQKALALPFHRSCASMEKYFQARFTVNRSNDRMNFNNFSNGYYFDNPNDYSSRQLGDISFARCSGGYITISSPQGSKVCKGTIHYIDPRSDAFAGGIGKGMTYIAEDCRWK